MPRPRSIVVGYHGSEASRRALDAAVDLAGYGSALAVVSVRPRHESGELERPLDAAREQLLRRQIPARYVERFGEAAEQLVVTADELGADLIVIGRRPSKLGSMSADVMSRAGCDALVVR